MKRGSGEAGAEEARGALQESPSYEEFQRRRRALRGAAAMTMTSLALSLPQATVALSVLACVFAALALWLLVWALRDVRGEEQASDPLRRDRQLSVLVVILGANALAQIPGIRPALEVLFLAALAAAIPLLYGAAIRHVRRALLSADEGEDTAEELDAAPDTRPE